MKHTVDSLVTLSTHLTINDNHLFVCSSYNICHIPRKIFCSIITLKFSIISTISLVYRTHDVALMIVPYFIFVYGFTFFFAVFLRNNFFLLWLGWQHGSLVALVGRPTLGIQTCSWTVGPHWFGFRREYWFRCIVLLTYHGSWRQDLTNHVSFSF